MAEDKRLKKRLAELNRIFRKLPKNRLTLLRETIKSVATMDVMLEDLERKIFDGTANTPDKQLYSSTAKTRDQLMRRLIVEMPAEDDEDPFDTF